MTERGGTDAAVFQAWWDPKGRKVVFNPGTFSVGLLAASRDVLAFTRLPQDTVFMLRRSEVDLTFSRHTMSVLLRTPGEKYRIYLAPPVKGVPTLSGPERTKLTEVFSAGTAIADKMGLAGGFLDTMVAIGDGLDVAGRLGEAVKLHSSWKDFVELRRILSG